MISGNASADSGRVSGQEMGQGAGSTAVPDVTNHPADIRAGVIS